MLTDKDFTHIICGYSAAGTIKYAFRLPKEQVVICGDALSVGQQFLTPNHGSWERLRIPAHCAAMDCEADLFEGPEKFSLFKNFMAMTDDRPILIWVDWSLNSHLMAAFVCHVGQSERWDNGHVQILRYPKTQTPYLGILSVLNEQQLKSYRPPAQVLTPKEREAYAGIWESFAGSNLEDLLKNLLRKSASNLTMGSLPYLLRRLPDRKSGLNEIDHDLLERIVSHEPSAVRAIAYALGYNETPDSVGDLYLYARLKRFGGNNLKQPLLEVENAEGSMRECKVKVLPLAHDILAGRANMIELNGLDDWLGGVHLTPANMIWRDNMANSA